VEDKDLSESQPNEKLNLIAKLCRNIDGPTEDIPDDFSNQMIDKVCIGIVKTIVSSSQDAWQQILEDFFELLKCFLFEQRQLAIFNKITSRVL
jgi:hypothetical protein